ncbi:MAG: hypothetical protein E7186_07305 [Erysipelotrichaceae bacterium]|nr:hypothetical protein [Erysipelotrichaceae bacterium]
MKKSMRLLTAILAVLLVLSSFASGFTVDAADKHTYSNAAEVAQLVDAGYNQGTKGPITITRGTLKKTFSSKEVYFITLSGTELVFNQSTEVLTDLFSGFNLKNAYYYNVVNVILNNIPKGANLFLAGHSLGGMICQQVAADATIKARYNILNVVTFGSPLLAAGFREGTIKRLGDINDVVPLLSSNLFVTPIRAILGLNRENGGYYLRPVSAHTDCYVREDVWGRYDVTGTKYGSARLELDLDTRKFYKSPIIDW